MKDIPLPHRAYYQQEYVPCGNCTKCVELRAHRQAKRQKNGNGAASTSSAPQWKGHGPYWYAYWREGKRQRSKYIGKTLPLSIANAHKLEDRQRVS